jgi:hypothetical protein
MVPDRGEGGLRICCAAGGRPSKGVTGTWDNERQLIRKGKIDAD